MPHQKKFLLRPVRMQQNIFFNWSNLIFVHYEESLLSSNLNSKLFRFHIAHPNLHTAHLLRSWLWLSRIRKNSISYSTDYPKKIINFDISARTFMYATYFKLLMPSCIPFGNKRICKRKCYLSLFLSYFLTLYASCLFNIHLHLAKVAC